MHDQQNTAGVHVRLQQALLSEIENFRRREIDLPTRPEAIRRLLQRAIAREEAAPASGLTQAR
jgi:metal-responsive CopG/Arc/MetJ family transcriptional regulator